MKRVLLMLCLSGAFAVSVMAQSVEGAGKANRDKTDEELSGDLKKFMKQASEEMAALEKELAKASGNAAKADVVAERVKKLREQMQSGKLDELPDGLREYLAAHPDDAAKLTGKSVDEIKKVAEKNDELLALLKGSPELLKKLADSEATFDEILRLQLGAEKRLQEALQRTQSAAEKAKENVNDSIDVAHELKARSP